MNEYIWLNLEIIINYFIYLITQLDINRKIEHYGRWRGGGSKGGLCLPGESAIFGIFTTLIYFCEFPLLSIPWPPPTQKDVGGVSNMGTISKYEY